MKSANVTFGERILPVENENDIEVFSTRKLPCFGRMAAKYDAFTGVRSNLDLGTN
jgi:hypothetical protein